MPPKPRSRSSSSPEGEEIYRLVVESAPNAMVLADAAGKITLVNRKAEELFGYSRREMLGKDVELLLPIRFRERHKGYRQDYAKAPERREMGAGRDLFARRKDGSEVPVEIGLNPIKTKDGDFVLAAVVDITDRKKAEERFQLAVEAAPNAMILADQEGTIVLANAQTERLFGYAREELLGKSVDILVPQAARARHKHLRSDYMAKPEARPMGAGRELYGVHKSGREVPVEIGLNPIRTGEQTFVLAAIVDVTERRELQRRVAQNEALAAVGAMAAVLAHEIRNPLGSIVMAAKSLGRADLSAEERQVVGGVLSEESQRLNRTLQDFLQFARPREPKTEPADLNRTVTDIVEAIKSDRDLAGGVSLDVNLDEDLRPFPHDADQLRQVLWNLILNGIQAMGGKGRLKVSTQVRPDRACVCVLDSGPGIDAEVLGKIFDPFYTTKKRGTGLGLAIAQRIIQAHGGSLSAANRPGAGAEFVVLLPLRP